MANRSFCILHPLARLRSTTEIVAELRDAADSAAFMAEHRTREAHEREPFHSEASRREYERGEELHLLRWHVRGLANELRPPADRCVFCAHVVGLREDLEQSPAHQSSVEVARD